MNKWWKQVLARVPRVTPEPVNARYHGSSNACMRSLKFAIRTLFRTPFVTAIAIVSLALGIGATAGIFSVFHQVLLQSLAVPDPSELVNNVDGIRRRLPQHTRHIR